MVMSNRFLNIYVYVHRIVLIPTFDREGSHCNIHTETHFCSDQIISDSECSVIGGIFISISPMSRLRKHHGGWSRKNLSAEDVHECYKILSSTYDLTVTHMN